METVSYPSNVSRRLKSTAPVTIYWLGTKKSLITILEYIGINRESNSTEGM